MKKYICLIIICVICLMISFTISEEPHDIITAVSTYEPYDQPYQGVTDDIGNLEKKEETINDKPKVIYTPTTQKKYNKETNMYFETKEDCKALSDEQIANLTMSECSEIENILGYSDPFMDKIYDRMRRLKAYESMNDDVGDLTVGKLRKFLDGLDDNDIINIYDIYMETSHIPDEVYVSANKDSKGRKHLFIQIDTD